MEEVTIGSARLIQADCRDVLPTLPRDLAVLSDPPYGPSNRPTAIAHWPTADRHSGVRIAGDDRPFDPAHLLGFAEILIWGADHYRTRLPEEGRMLGWDKLAGNLSWDSFSDIEFAWHSVRGASRVFSWLWKGVCCRRTGEGEGGVVRRYIPTQKPIALMRWCIGQIKNTGAILDPYMGSGTTGVACAQLGRRFIGIEIEPRWFDIACRRIAAAQKVAAEAA